MYVYAKSAELVNTKKFTNHEALLAGDYVQWPSESASYDLLLDLYTSLLEKKTITNCFIHQEVKKVKVVSKLVTRTVEQNIFSEILSAYLEIPWIRRHTEQRCNPYACAKG